MENQGVLRGKKRGTQGEKKTAGLFKQGAGRTSGSSREGAGQKKKRGEEGKKGRGTTEGRSGDKENFHREKGGQTRCFGRGALGGGISAENRR